ncbi:MAG: zf-HC2 domain-containing protein [Candidatus Aminicenantes bacterium]|nr:zf-HC2 domain-containing protein [Candidatus Aminicenantes bacterium]
MGACGRIRPWLEWLAADEIADDRRQAVEAHLASCPSCRRELHSWRMLLAAAESNAETDAVMEGIDWDALSRRIVSRSMTGGDRAGKTAPRPLLALVPLAAAILIVVAGLGIFFWTRGAKLVPPGREDGALEAASVAHLESGLARREVVTYLQQSQVMLTGLLKNCASEEIAPWEMRLAERQARELLLKKKYFRQHLSELEWSKVRNVSERIDWLSYEILQLGDQRLCERVSRLQRIMEDERLLLKIRLIQSDFAWQPLREA